MATLQEEADYLQLKIASPEEIEEWSYGEVTKSETVNYRTYKPEKDGLFCERIFGPTKDYRCSVGCGKYNKAAYAGIICEECGVEVTEKKVRRERMGHIQLEVPIVHRWFFHKKPKYLNLILNMKDGDLLSVIYCKTHIVLDPLETPLEYKQILTDKQYAQCVAEYGRGAFVADTGGRAVKSLLEDINLQDLYEQLKEEYEQTKTQKRNEIGKRMRAVNDFIEAGNKPEWMVMDKLPVFPPDLRPMVPLDGGRYATSDLNELYRRVIMRNTRLKRLFELKSPRIIVDNEINMLQTAVDSLFSNQERARPVTGPGNRAFKSLSSYLEGKGGRFRQNLLGKRVDYSGRSVIAVGPNLTMNQVGLPREMALELFKPYVINQMMKRGYAESFKTASQKIEHRNEKVWDVLEDVVTEHPVALNRAPTLHRLSIRGFEPVIVEGKAIRLHPLVCGAYNADFDGDTMSVHVPISREAQAEVRVLLMATANLRHPQNGKSAVSPSQDMVLGCYYLSMEDENHVRDGCFFSKWGDVQMAYEQKSISLHTRIVVYVGNDPRFDGKYLVTTYGKMAFNEAVPDEVAYINNGVIDFVHTYGLFNTMEEAQQHLGERKVALFKKSFLEDYSTRIFDVVGQEKTAELLDVLMTLGFKYSTVGGVTISVDDVAIPEEKPGLIKAAQDELEEVEEMYQWGFISKGDRKNFVVGKWSKVSEVVADKAMEVLETQKKNPIWMMTDSSARGSKNQYRQLAAMRGLMADPNGQTIERPILTNFKEGLDVFDYFISSHGARKGMVDTAIKTADSGYLTRRLVDVSHEVVVNEKDCGTKNFLDITAIDVHKDQPTVSLEDRLVGRVLAEKRKGSSGKVYKAGDMLTEADAKDLAADSDSVPIRTALTCEAKRGVCQLCYGKDMADTGMVQLGEAVGVIAAQSIGEPGTQLTMRTFHSGGVAGDDITQGLPRIQELFEARKTVKGMAELAPMDGKANVTKKTNHTEITIENEGKDKVFRFEKGKKVLVEDGQELTAGDALTAGSIDTNDLLRHKGVETTQKYIVDEVHRVYTSQGVKISDKHVEVIVRQMTKRVRVVESGGTDYVVGSILEKGEAERINRQLPKKKPKMEYRPMLLGLTAASLQTDSLLSAASFQETSRILSEAAAKGKKDYILGLKESVILARKIPAGTGFIKESQK